ncbi:MAG: hypothetical protein IJ590_03170 [Rickettsiales bacterium]|nr:hypothetical protein [Rickettsiales bacterium]
MWLDLNKDGETTTEEFNACINAKDSKTGQDAFTAEEKIAAQKTFKEADTNNDGKVDTTEAIKYSFQNGRESISQDKLKAAYGEKKASEMMKYDKDGNGKLDKKEFDEATKEKEGINFKDPKTILAIVGIAITVIGLIIGLCVWLSRRNKKKKEEQEKLKVDQQLKSGSVNMPVSTGNSAEKVHSPISSQTQQQSNDIFSQYSQSSINNTQQPLNLNDSRKSMYVSR